MRRANDEGLTDEEVALGVLIPAALSERGAIKGAYMD